MKRSDSKKNYDIFAALKAIDRREFDFYTKNPDPELDKFLGFPALRWTSGCEHNNDHEYYLASTNIVANKHYFQFSQHRELQWKLLCATGMNSSKVRHSWLPPLKKRGGDLMRDVLFQLYPHMKEDEASLWLKVNGVHELLILAKKGGIDNDTVEKLSKSLGQAQGSDS